MTRTVTLLLGCRAARGERIDLHLPRLGSVLMELQLHLNMFV